MLEHLISLVSLDLGENRISQLHSQLFLANNDLEVLVLDSNLVRNIIQTYLCTFTRHTDWRLAYLWETFRCEVHR